MTEDNNLTFRYSIFAFIFEDNNHPSVYNYSEVMISTMISHDEAVDY